MSVARVALIITTIYILPIFVGSGNRGDGLAAVGVPAVGVSGLVAAAALLVLLSGCLAVTVQDEVRANGSARVSMEIDFAGLAQGSAGEELRAQLEKSCDEQDVDEKIVSLLTGIECRVEGTKLTVSGERGSLGDALAVEPGFPFTTYRYYPGRTENLAGAALESESAQQLGGGSDLAEMARAGLSFKYRVKMPGEIVGVEGGKSVGGVAEFDVLSGGLSRDSVVVSRELNYGVVAAAAAALLVVAGGAYYFLVARKKSGKSGAVGTGATARTGKASGGSVAAKTGASPFEDKELDALAELESVAEGYSWPGARRKAAAPVARYAGTGTGVDGGAVGKNGNPLLDIYFAWEDKWYAFLDKVNEHVPVNGVIDKIDEYVPSFVLFLLLLLLLLLGGGWLAWTAWQGSGGAAFTGALFKVVDEDEAPLQGIEVELRFLDGSEVYESDEAGEFTLPFQLEEVEAVVEEPRFKPYRETLPVFYDRANLIRLQGVAEAPQTRSLVFIDEQGNPVTTEVMARFSCSGNVLPPTPKTAASGQMDVVYVPACGTLSARITAQGYEEKTAVLLGQRTVVTLTKKGATANALVNVLVRERGSGNPLGGIEVRLYDAENNWKDSGKTDSSGSYAFNVFPGNYFVVARDESGAHAEGTSQAVTVGSNENKTVVIELDAQDAAAAKSISLKFVDKGSGQAVSAVDAKLFKADGLLVTEAKSDSEGKVVFANVGADSFVLVAAHPSYVSRRIENVKAEEKVRVIELEKATQENSGSVKVIVKDFSGKEVKEAEAKVFADGSAVQLARAFTGADGAALFGNLPPGRYYAKAFKEPEEGVSAPGDLLPGKTLELPVTLVFAKGSLVVEVVDRQGNALQGASVRFVDALTGNVLASGETGVDGKTQEHQFKVNASPRLIVSKDGFVTRHTTAYEIVAKTRKEVRVVLEPADAYSEMALRLAGVYQGADRTKKARTLTKNTEFWVKFEAYLDQERETVDAVVRTGLESEATALDSLVVVRDADAVDAQVIKNAGFDAGNPYNDVNPTDADGKSVRVRFENLEKGIHEFWVKIFIKNTDEAAAPVEVRFGLRADRGNEFAYKPSQTELYLRRFALGELLACEASDAECENFVFSFTLNDPTGKHLLEPVVLQPGVKQELWQGIVYALDFLVFNGHREGLSFGDTALAFSSNSPRVVVTPASVPLGRLENGTAVSGSVNLQANGSANAVQLEAGLGLGEAGDSTTRLLGVKAKNALALDVQPGTLPAQTTNYLGVFVRDPETLQPVQGATVKLSLNEDHSSPFVVGETGADGFFMGFVDRLEAGRKVYVLAEKEFFASASDDVDVVAQGISFEAEPGFECLGVAPQDLTVLRNLSGSFAVSASNCARPVELWVQQPAAGQPLTLRNADGSMLSLAAAPNLSLAETQSKNVVVRGDSYLGEYGILLKARFAGQQEFRDFARVRVLVNSDRPSEQCFSLDKTTFDIFQRIDSGIATNNCYRFIADPWMPRIAFENYPKAFVSGAFQGPTGAITFTYKVRAIIQEETGQRILVDGPNTETITPLPDTVYDLKELDQKIRDALAALAVFDPDDEESLDIVRFEIEHDAQDKFDLFLDGFTVKARYVGGDTDDGGIHPFEVNNYSLEGEEYALLKVTDYVDTGDADAFSELEFRYTVSSQGTEGNSDGCPIDASIPADGQPHSLGRFDGDADCFVAGEGTSYYVANDSQFVETFFASTGTATTTKQDDAVVAVSAVNFEVGGGKVDVAYIGDASGSFGDPFRALCRTGGGIDKVRQLFEDAGFDVETKVYSIGHTGYDSSPGPAVHCAEEALDWGDEEYAYDPTRDEAYEFWGPATQDLLKKHEWRPGATRLVFVMADNVPSGGDGGGAFRPNGEEEGILQNTVEALQANNARIYFIRSTPEIGIKDKYGDPTVWDVHELMVAAAEATGGKVFEFGGSFGSFESVLELLVEYILRNQFAPAASETFHVRLKAGEASVCYGPNDVKGATGANAFPRLQYSWSWGNVPQNLCDKTNPDYVYCDATQFSMALVKKLDKAMQLAAERKMEEMQPLLHFDAYLLEDGYTDAFKAAFDEFAREIAFFDAPSAYKSDAGLWQYFTSPGKLSFESVETSSPRLPSPGLYRVDIEFGFPPGREFVFFEGGQAAASVRVRFTRLQGLDVKNVLYKLPLDGAIGVKGTEERRLEREGFGVSFSGETVDVKSEETVKTYATTSANPVASVTVERDASFAALNNVDSRGMLLEVSPDGSGYGLRFAPSYAAPVLLKVRSHNGVAEAHYAVVDASTQPVDLGGSGAQWTGVASDLAGCTDFSGGKLFYKRPDVKNAGCTVSAQQPAYGFRWTNAPAGEIYLQTILYTPLDSYSVTSVCSSSDPLMLSASPKAINSNADFIGLPHLAEPRSLAAVLELVKGEWACMGADTDSLKVWWNEKRVYRELERYYQEYFASLKAGNANFQVCPATGAVR